MLDDGARIEDKYKRRKINGQTHHWNEPHEGAKYSVIVYRRSAKSKKTEIINRPRSLTQAKDTEQLSDGLETQPTAVA